MSEGTSPRPNIVFILADQLRHDFLGCYGADFVNTPNIDALASRGTRYTRAYSSSPVCVPARASLLTGLNAVRNGVTGNGTWLRPDLAQCGIKTWPEFLNDQGYYTAGIGKMHFNPWDCRMGFGHRVACEDKRWIKIRDDYYHFLRERGLHKLHGEQCDGYHEGKGAFVSPISWEVSVDRFVGQEACRFVRTHGSDGPFAMMVSFPGPHCPYDPVPEFLERIDPTRMPDPIEAIEADSGLLRQGNINGNKGAWNGVDYSEFSAEHKQKIRAHYAALVEQIDHEVGDIVASLEETGQLDNTVIVFSSDHGDYLGDHNLIGKGTFYEGSCHVPLIVRPAGGGDAVTHDGLVELGDVTATMLGLGGCLVPDYMDSIPLPGTGVETQRVRQRVVGMVQGGWMLYDGRWKLSKYSTGDVHLFDMQRDPQERRNRATDPTCAEMRAAMDAELMQEIMRSMLESHRDKGVDAGNALWSDSEYGKEGQPRPYPNPMV
jgi:arylsulfatase